MSGLVEEVDVRRVLLFAVEMIAQGDAVQFPYVAPPAVVFQDRAQGRGNIYGVACQPFQEYGEQVKNIRWPFIEGRQVQCQWVEAEIEVAAETARFDLGDDIGIAGRDDADVKGNDIIRSDAHDLPRFQDAQQFGLDVGGHTIDFIEENRAVMSQLEESGFPFFAGPRKRATLVAEELALQQFWRQGGAVYGDKRTAAARAGIVDALGKEFLAGTAFSLDEDR